MTEMETLPPVKRGDRVMLNRDGKSLFNDEALHSRSGTAVGLSRDRKCVYVTWDGCKGKSCISVNFLRPSNEDATRKANA